MSQLVVRPGRNAAREAKRVKEIRKVKGAILWHERERKERQKTMQERYETRQAKLQMQRFEHDRAKDRGKALRNAKEDWKLGAIRPDRSIGDAKAKYGALTGAEIQKPETPLHALKAKNERRTKLGLEPQCPLIVDDKKYFHLAKDDRVVILRGREMGKIGTIQTVIGRTHEVTVEGLNMQYFDGNQFSGTAGDAPKRLSEVPISMDDVRLVVPYQITKKERSVEKDENGQIIGESFKDVIVREDVIVDNITMKQHITGIDPYTNIDYGNSEFPKEHRLDPQTGLPIFHRYIAGTNHRIEWPWEMETAIEDSGAIEGVEEDSRPAWRKLAGAVFLPYKRWRGTDGTSSTAMTAAAEQTEKEIAERVSEIEREVDQARRTAKPSSQDPRHYSGWDKVDTPQDIFEQVGSASYTLVHPPFPPELGSELAVYKRGLKNEALKKKDTDKNKNKNKEKDDEVTPELKTKKKKIRKVSTESGATTQERKQAAAQRMKTPMQIRWETEHAKKAKQAPLVTVDEIFDAVQRHLNRHKVAKAKAAAEKEAKEKEAAKEVD